MLPLLALGCDTPASPVLPPDLVATPCDFRDPPVAKVDLEAVDRAGTWTVYVTGVLMDAPEPTSHLLLAEAGSCRYWVWLPVTCSPACEADEVCDGGGACVPSPVGLDGGVLRVEGPAGTLELPAEPAEPGEYRREQALDRAPAASDAWSASIAGGDFPAFGLQTSGIAPIEPDAADSGLLLTDGEDALLTWEAGDNPDACVEATLYTYNASHGAPIFHVLECIAPDGGSLAIPAELVDIYPDWDTPGVCVGRECPYSELVRTTRAAVETAAGEAWLTVSHTGYFPLRSGGG